MSIKDAIVRAFDKKKKFDKRDESGNWRYPMFWAIDLHDVIIPGTYTRENAGRKFFPNAEVVLQWLTRREDMKLILFTSSHGNAIQDILEWMFHYGISFDYANENPECTVTTTLCAFDRKFYFDVMLEDKAGFNGDTDWFEIQQCLKDINEWEKLFHHDPEKNASMKKNEGVYW